MELRAKINNVSNITSNKIATYNTQHIVIENMTKVTSLASAFANCYSLQKIEFKNCDTKAVTNMSSTFQYCYSLSDFSFLDDFDTSSCVNMTAFLMACAGLTEFDASRLDFSSCTNISSFLSGCYNLKSASFKGTDLSKVTTIPSIIILLYNICIRAVFINNGGIPSPITFLSLPMFVIPFIISFMLMVQDHRLIPIIGLLENHPTMTRVL